MAAGSGEKGKGRKSFEFRMSKKVAELTQVVHMLFTKNHEREVEIQTLTELYNAELDRLHSKHKAKVEKLKQSQEAEQAGQFDEKVRQALEENDSNWTAKCDALETRILSEQMSQAVLKDSLAKAETEMAEMKQSSNESLFALRTQLTEKQSQLEKLTKRNTELERKVAEQKRKLETEFDHVKQSLEDQQLENAKLREMLEESTIAEELAVKKQQKMEGELLSAKRELTKTASEMSDVRHRLAEKSLQPLWSSTPQGVNEELDNLRRLVQKYRLELSNREGNFNRMFTDKTPVLVDQHNALGTLMTTARGRGKDRSISYDLSHPLDSYDMDRPSKILTPAQRSESSLSGNRRLTSIRRPIPNRSILTQYSQLKLDT